MFNPQLSPRGELLHFLSTEGLPKRLLESLLDAHGGGAALAGREVCLIGPDGGALQALEQAALALGAATRRLAAPPAASQADIHVLRHPASGAAHALAARLPRVVNAGDGWHARPLAALADLLAIRQAKGGFTELRVAFIGDFAHSGRGRSLAHALTTLGAPELRAAGPRALLPEGLPQLGLRVCDSLAQAVDGADVVVELGLTEAALSVLPSAEDYARRWTPGAAEPGALRLGPPDGRGLLAASMAVFRQLAAGAP